MATTKYWILRAAVLGLLALMQVICWSTFSAQAEPNVQPGGASGTADLEEWTLEGPLSDAPSRSNNAYPLSDQSNQSGWMLDIEASDEFNGAKLDSTRWSPIHRTWVGRAPAKFLPQNVELSSGNLQLVMRKDGADRQTVDGEFHTYTSAAVQAREKTIYGYYEVRSKPMDSAGSSSFWFAGREAGWRSEIDVYELGGKAPGHENRYNMNLHVFHTPTDQRHRNWGGVWRAPYRFADDYHTFGLEWAPDRISYYVDGVLVRWVENAHWHKPLYLIFDSETMPEWLGLPEDGDLPSFYQIDYLRVWRRNYDTSMDSLE